MSKNPNILIDNYGRQLDYLRLSVTDRCNLRCQYCMPQEGIDFVPRDDLLSYEEMLRLASIFQSLGVRKIRITGGEPFVRKDIGDFLLALRQEVNMEEIHITTNGTLIEKFLEPIVKAQLDSVNVSIDSLSAEEFMKMTRRDEFHNAWDGIRLLQENNIKSKINVVIQKGFNDDQILPFVSITKDKETHVRFIEMMPFNGSQETGEEMYINADKILADIKKEYKNIIPVEQSRSSSSLLYKIPGHKGTVAIIPALSRSLCGTCNRIRLSATGDLRTCLYADPYINLKKIINEGATDEDIKAILIDAVQHKHKNGFDAEDDRLHHMISESMSSIGG